MTIEEQTLEDAIIANLHESVFDPEKAANLIRNNVKQRITCTYTVRFYQSPTEGIVMETNLLTEAQPKRLGRRVGLV